MWLDDMALLTLNDDERNFLYSDFHDQSIPPNYYDLLNYDKDDNNNIPGTPVDDVLMDNKWVEYADVPNDEYIDKETTIDDADSLDSAIDPIHLLPCKLKEWMRKMKEWKMTAE